MPYPSNPYQSDAVATATPANLVTMLYDRVLVAIERVCAVDDLGAATSVPLVNFELQRAQDVLTELQVTLDHERGGTIAGNLRDLYSWCLDILVTANVRKDASALPGVARVVGDLRDAWSSMPLEPTVALVGSPAS